MRILDGSKESMKSSSSNEVKNGEVFNSADFDERVLRAKPPFRRPVDRGTWMVENTSGRARRMLMWPDSIVSHYSLIPSMIHKSDVARLTAQGTGIDQSDVSMMILSNLAQLNTITSNASLRSTKVGYAQWDKMGSNSLGKSRWWLRRKPWL